MNTLFVSRAQYGPWALLTGAPSGIGRGPSAHDAATKAYTQTLGEGLRTGLKPLEVDVLVAAPSLLSTVMAEMPRALP